MRDVTPSQRAQYLIARLLACLPDRLKIRLSGEPAIVIDGQQYDPQLQLLRSIERRRGVRGLIEPTIEAGRRRYRHTARVFRGPITPVGAVRDFEIPGPAGPLAVRHYAPAAEQAGSRAPLTVYFHGGGFVIGDLDTHDEPCRILCREGDVHVLSVAYRLAPEHPFPAAVDDALAAWLWARASAGELGADPARVVVGGDSAGANLAAVVTILAPENVAPQAQLLIYPPTDTRTARPSHALFGTGFLLTLADRDAFYREYVGAAPLPSDDPRVSPLRAASFSSAPPALVVVAGFDVLRDEGDEYAAALQRAGVPVAVMRFPSMPHGFIHVTGVCPSARAATVSIARAWRRLLQANSA